VSLLNQAFVKNDKQTIEQMLKAADAAVQKFTLFVVGEGIEKKSGRLRRRSGRASRSSKAAVSSQAVSAAGVRSAAAGAAAGRPGTGPVVGACRISISPLQFVVVILVARKPLCPMPINASSSNSPAKP
jgi:hypothetical protein